MRQRSFRPISSNPMSSATERWFFFSFLPSLFHGENRMYWRQQAGRKRVAKALMIWCMIVTLVCVCVWAQAECMDLLYKALLLYPSAVLWLLRTTVVLGGPSAFTSSFSHPLLSYVTVRPFHCIFICLLNWTDSYFFFLVAQKLIIIRCRCSLGLLGCWVTNTLVRT